MKQFAALILTLALGHLALAQESHTDQVCLKGNPALCAHIGFDQAFDTQTAETFMLHFVTTGAGADVTKITDLRVDLWMSMGHMGHGSAPVQIDQMDSAHYKVSEAYFPMAGTWLVRAHFTYDGQAEELDMPVSVQ